MNRILLEQMLQKMRSFLIKGKNIGDLKKSLEKDTVNALAWMVADEVLEFKFAVPRDKKSVGDYHDKIGVVIVIAAHPVSMLEGAVMKGRSWVI